MRAAALPFLLILFVRLAVVQGIAADVSSLVYEKKETRSATRDASIAATSRQLKPYTQTPWKRLAPTGDRSLPKSGEHGYIDPGMPVKTASGSVVAWRPAEDIPEGDWTTIEGAVGWLYRQVVVSNEQQATLVLGVDGFIKFFVNGVDLQSFATTASMKDRLSRFTVPLKAGTNHLMISIGATPMAFHYELSPVGPEWLAALDARLDIDFPQSSEARYYRIETIPVPANIVLEVGGLAFDPDGALVVATRRGEIWKFNDHQWRRYAHGLHEPLGVFADTDSSDLYVLQRPELTRIWDSDRDGVGDSFQTVSDAWSLSGGHHEYMFGPVRDRDGNFWGVISGLCDATKASYCGWVFRVNSEGDFTPWCTGFRSPNGIGITPEGDIFVSDNQGEWVGTSPLYHVQKGAFYGYPKGLQWDETYKGDLANPDPAELDKMRKPAAILFPYGAMGHSLSQPLVDTTQGQFGPFTGQMFIGDQSKCTLMRVALEKVDGEFQGACFPFRSGFQSGINRLVFAADGSLYVGQTDRGWGSIGGRPYGLQRVAWNGVVPMEIHSMTLTPSGFTLRFTKPVDPQTAGNPAAWSMQHYRYAYHAAYGSPVLDRTPVTVDAVEVSSDHKSVVLTLPELVAGRVYELHLDGVRGEKGEPVVHPEAYYTLNRLMTNQ